MRYETKWIWLDFWQKKGADEISQDIWGVMGRRDGIHFLCFLEHYNMWPTHFLCGKVAFFVWLLFLLAPQQLFVLNFQLQMFFGLNCRWILSSCISWKFSTELLPCDFWIQILVSFVILISYHDDMVRTFHDQIDLAPLFNFWFTKYRFCILVQNCSTNCYRILL